MLGKRKRCSEVLQDISSNREEDATTSSAVIDVDGYAFNKDKFSKTEIKLLFDKLIYAVEEKRFDTVREVIGMMLSTFKDTDVTTCIEIRQEYTSFLLFVISSDTDVDLDYHLMLESLAAGFRILPKEKKQKLVAKDDVRMKLVLLLLSIFKEKQTIFPCGCVQTIVFDLLSEEEGNLLFKSLDNVYNILLPDGDKKTELFTSSYKHVFLKRIELKPVVVFQYFVALIENLVRINAIENGGTILCDRRIPHLLTLLVKIPRDSFADACAVLLRLLPTLEDNGNMRLRRALYPKVVTKMFEFYSEVDSAQFVQIANKVSNIWATKIVEDFKDEVHSVVISPLRLLILILRNQEALKLVSSTVEKLTSEHLKYSTIQSSESFFTFLLTLLNLSTDPNTMLRDIIDHVVRCLNKGQTNETDIAFKVADVITELGGKNALLQNLRLSQKVALGISNFASTSTKKFVLDTLSRFNPEELALLDVNRLLSELDQREVSLMFEKLSALDYEVKCDLTWKGALKRIQEVENASRFACSQIGLGIMLVQKGQTSAVLKSRYNDVVDILNSDRKIPPFSLLVGFVEQICSMDMRTIALSPIYDRLSLTPLPNTVFPMALVACCAYGTSNETRVNEMLLRVRDSVRDNFDVDALKNDVNRLLVSDESAIIIDNLFEISKKVCEYNSKTHVLNGKSCNPYIWAKNGSVFPKQIKMILTANDGPVESKEYTASIVTKMLDYLSQDLLQAGLRATKAGEILSLGAGSYCGLISTVCDDFLRPALKTYAVSQSVESLAESLFEALVKCNEKKLYLFVAARIGTVLEDAEPNTRLFDQLLQIVAKNEDVVRAVKNRREYSTCLRGKGPFVE